MYKQRCFRYEGKVPLSIFGMEWYMAMVMVNICFFNITLQSADDKVLSSFNRSSFII